MAAQKGKGRRPPKRKVKSNSAPSSKRKMMTPKRHKQPIQRDKFGRFVKAERVVVQAPVKRHKRTIQRDKFGRFVKVERVADQAPVRVLVTPTEQLLDRLTEIMELKIQRRELPKEPKKKWRHLDRTGAQIAGRELQFNEMLNDIDAKRLIRKIVEAGDEVARASDPEALLYASFYFYELGRQQFWGSLGTKFVQQLDGSVFVDGYEGISGVRHQQFEWRVTDKVEGDLIPNAQTKVAVWLHRVVIRSYLPAPVGARKRMG